MGGRKELKKYCAINIEILRKKKTRNNKTNDIRRQHTFIVVVEKKMRKKYIIITTIILSFLNINKILLKNRGDYGISLAFDWRCTNINCHFNACVL